MSKPKDSDRIPTLTEIVKSGDTSMENHFDGLLVEQIQEQDKPDIKLDQQVIDDMINEVINSTMPSIERQLRNQLASILKKYRSGSRSD